MIGGLCDRGGCGVGGGLASRVEDDVQSAAAKKVENRGVDEMLARFADPRWRAGRVRPQLSLSRLSL